VHITLRFHSFAMHLYCSTIAQPHLPFGSLVSCALLEPQGWVLLFYGYCCCCICCTASASLPYSCNVL
jgi:hypothetical protein